MVNVLFAVSECVPFVKSGGLADVAGALPKELQKLGTEVRVILPNYGMIADTLKKECTLKKVITVSLGWRQQYCGILENTIDDVTYYLIDNEYYFKRDSLYGYDDDGERYSFFCKAVLDCLPYLDFHPDIIHHHDWHTGMIGFLLDTKYRDIPFYKDMKTVFTIHNLQFQGVFPKVVMDDYLALDNKYFHSDCLEFYGNISFMKGGMLSADRITTVSETYRHEIQYPFFGENLDGLLRVLDHKLVGIVNGIDNEVYNPATDSKLVVNYDSHTLENKVVNKLFLQETFGLQQSKSTPIIAMVTRLTSQKGLDLVRHVFHEIMREDIQFILLGTGEKEYENFFSGMEYMYKDKVRSYIGFSEEIASTIYAGSDLFLMPSLFEPCGLGQLIAMQYGTIPIVRETGGLNDTVQSYNEYTGEGNGFSFTNYNAHDMLHTIKRAIDFYHQDDWNNIVEQTMKKDYSWKQSAKLYNDLYQQLLP